ncbi:MAG: rhomboid family intramembrane serine protease [Parahaliea sp.]
MTHIYTALDVELEEDLLPLSVVLRQQGVDHRVFEERGRQLLKVSDPDMVAPVVRAYESWRAGEIAIELRKRPRSREDLDRWHGAPVTLGLIALSVAGFLLIYLHAPLVWLEALTYTPFRIVGNGEPVFLQRNTELWRLVTPAFLHFGWLHIVFNSLWLWDLGARVERALGSFNMAGLFLVIAIVSNTAQYLFGGPGLFGGMSGVVYGMLGFSWVGGLLQPRWGIQPRPAIMLFMVGWLVICVFGVVEVLGFGAVANAAHVGGLLSGALLGLLFAGLAHLSQDKSGAL